MLLTNGNGQLLLTALFFDRCSLDYWSFLWQETYGVVSNHYLILGPISHLNSILWQNVDTCKMRWMLRAGLPLCFIAVSIITLSLFKKVQFVNKNGGWNMNMLLYSMYTTVKSNGHTIYVFSVLRLLYTLVFLLVCLILFLLFFFSRTHQCIYLSYVEWALSE